MSAADIATSAGSGSLGRRLAWPGTGTALALASAAVIVLCTVLGEWLAPYSATQIVGPPSHPPSGDFWLGTDQTGMDVFSRTIVAARIDVLIALSATTAATAAGVLAGLLIGMNESRRNLLGYLARGCSRFLDLLEAVPTIIVSLVVVAFFGINQVTLVVALAVILTPIQARLTRTEVLRVRTEAYLDAARQAGLSEFEVTRKHVLPNSVLPALQNSSVVFGITIVLTAALGFLGVGLPPPTPEWGSMITRGTGDAAVGKWWAATAPALALCITVATVSVLARRITRRRDG